MQVENFKYPVFVFPFSGRSVVLAKDELFFKVASRSQLSNFFKIPFNVIDSNGIEYSAEKLCKLGGKGRFSGWDIFLNQTLRIEIFFKEVGAMPFQKIQERIKAALRDDPTGIWLGGEETTGDYCPMIDKCETVTDIFEILGPQGLWPYWMNQ